MTAAQGASRRNAFSRVRDAATRRPGFLRNIVVLIVTMVVGVTIFAIFVGQQDLILPWQHQESYFANFGDASAISPGQHQEIRVAGVHVGDIGKASVTPGGQAHVQFQITDAKLKVYQNATALLQAKTPLNEMYIELSPGTPAAPPLKQGGTIPLAQTQSPIEVDQILQHLGPNVQAGTRVLLEETNAALVNASDYLPNDLAATDSTVTNLQPLAQALSTREAKIRTLISDLTQIASVAGGNQGRLAQILNSAETTLTTLARNDGGLSQTLQDLPGTTQTLGSALPKVQALAGQVNPLLDHIRGSANILPQALGQLNGTLKNLDPVLSALRPVITDGNPLVSNLRGYLVSANPSLGKLDQIGTDLPKLASYVAYDMPWLNGFFFNTNSLTSTENQGKPQVRSLVVAGGNSLGGGCGTITSLLGAELPSLGPVNGVLSAGGSSLCKALNLGAP